MLSGTAASAVDRLMLILLILVAAVLLHDSVVAPQSDSRTHPTTAAILSSSAVPACKYGSQAYYFVDSDSAQFNETPDDWHLRAFDPSCQPQNLLSPLLNVSGSKDSRRRVDSSGGRGGGSSRADNKRKLTIIIYGDSIDRLMVEWLCKTVGSNLMSDPGGLKPIREKWYVSTTWCETDEFLCMHTWTNGMVPQDKEVYSPTKAFQHSSGLFHKLTGRRSPDILLFASCFWDLHSWINVDSNRTLFSAKQGMRALPFLGEERMRRYMSNVQAYVDMLRAGYPETRFLAMRTANFKNPRALLAYDGLEHAWGESAMRLPAGHSKQLLWNNWIALLNTALRHMAAKEGIPVIDLEALAHHLPAAYVYTGDGLHPHPQFLVTVLLNLVLNEYNHCACGSIDATDA